MDTRPTVLHPIDLSAFIQHVINRMRGPVHLIICSSQEEFLQQLLTSIQHVKDTAIAQAEAAGVSDQRMKRLISRKHDLLVPTLFQLSQARNVKVTFCATLPQLLAYLSSYHLNDHLSANLDENRSKPGQGHPKIALLNPISLHRNISSFSAQGLSRTFASAVEAASRVKAKLLVVECPSQSTLPADITDDLNPDEMMLDAPEEEREQDPWEEEVAILNVTTKSFGVGEKGWVGRTVKIKRIVERWCVFEKPDI